MKLNPFFFGLFVVALLLLAVTALRPAWISDSNAFLQGFINHEYLNVLGVIFAIALASLAQAHLSLNQLEENQGRRRFSRTRKEIKEAAYWLIALFSTAFVLVVAKPLICVTETETAIANALAIFLLALYVLVLLDVIMAVFKLEPDIGSDQS